MLSANLNVNLVPRTLKFGSRTREFCMLQICTNCSKHFNASILFIRVFPYIISFILLKYKSFQQTLDVCPVHALKSYFFSKQIPRDIVTHDCSHLCMKVCISVFKKGISFKVTF